jgi:hypothetical protein
VPGLVINLPTTIGDSYLRYRVTKFLEADEYANCVDDIEQYFGNSYPGRSAVRVTLKNPDLKLATILILNFG